MGLKLAAAPGHPGPLRLPGRVSRLQTADWEGQWPPVGILQWADASGSLQALFPGLPSFGLSCPVCFAYAHVQGLVSAFSETITAFSFPLRGVWG